jgi:hypothetical protein
MLVQAILASALLLDATGGVTADSLKLTLDVYPDHEVMQGDVFFLRLTIRNDGKTPVALPSRANPRAGNFTIWVQGMKSGVTQNYELGPIEDSMQLYTPLKPGESRVLYYSYQRSEGDFVLGHPSNPAHPFFRTPGESVRVSAKLTFQAPVEWLSDEEKAKIRSGAAWRLIDLVADGPEVRVKPRPQAELQLLAGLWKESQSKETTAAREWQPSWYGLPSSDNEWKLIAQQLSNSSVRDRLQCIRFTRALAKMTDEARQPAFADQLIAWLDGLSEIERHCVARQMMLVRLYACRTPSLSGQFDMVYRLANRLPPQYRRESDCREVFLRRCLSRDPIAFASFLKAKGETYPWIDQALALPKTPNSSQSPAPAKTTPPGNASTPAATKKPASEKSPPPATTQPGRKN